MRDERKVGKKSIRKEDGNEMYLSDKHSLLNRLGLDGWISRQVFWDCVVLCFVLV